MLSISLDRQAETQIEEVTELAVTRPLCSALLICAATDCHPHATRPKSRSFAALCQPDRGLTEEAVAAAEVSSILVCFCDSKANSDAIPNLEPNSIQSDRSNWKRTAKRKLNNLNRNRTKQKKIANH